MSDSGTGNHEDALKLWVVLSRARAAVGRHAKLDIHSHGFSEGEFAVLELLLHKQEPLLLGEIQRKILLSSGGITYIVDRLEKKGLVERRRCEEDRRAIYAALTEAGEAKIRSIFPQHARAIAHAVAGLSQAEQAQAIDLLRRLGRNAAATAEKGSPDRSTDEGEEGSEGEQKPPRTGRR